MKLTSKPFEHALRHVEKVYFFMSTGIYIFAVYVIINLSNERGMYV